MTITRDTIEQCKHGDKAAFAVIVKVFQSRIFRLALRLMCDNDEAEDMVQETFIKVWCNIGSYGYGSSFETWVYRIACNCCYDRLRQIRSHTHTDCEVPNLCLIAEGDVHEDVANRDLCKLIMHYTENLSPMQKLVFTLRDLEDFSTMEVCKMTGLSIIQVKSNLYHARKYIKNKLKEEER